MSFDLPKVFDRLAKKVEKEPAYLKHLEKFLDPLAYRGLLAWMELNKSQKIITDSIILNSDNPRGLQKLSDAMIRVKSIHEQVGAEISSIEEAKVKI
jgi:hypothetical protein